MTAPHRVEVPRKVVERLLVFMERHSPGASAAPQWMLDAADLRSALSPRPKSSARKKTEARNRTKRAKTRNVRALVALRADSVCECGCGRWFRGVGGAATMDHFLGVARSETVETCWMLRWDCHQEKTLNRPSAAAWLDKFIAHCERHGYASEAALARRDRIAILGGAR